MVRAMLADLARTSGRKTVVLVSTGIMTSDRPGGRPNIGDMGLWIGQEAAKANATVYSLFIDSQRTERTTGASRRPPRRTDDVSRDSLILSQALSEVGAMSGGMLLTAIQGSGEFAFDRVLGETSAFYLLGVEPAESDRDGRPRQLTVKANTGQRGAAVRARSWVVVPKPGSEPAVSASAPSEARPGFLTTAPTAEDVAAWERFWSGPGAIPPGDAGDGWPGDDGRPADAFTPQRSHPDGV